MTDNLNIWGVHYIHSDYKRLKAIFSLRDVWYLSHISIELM